MKLHTLRLILLMLSKLLRIPRIPVLHYMQRISPFPFPMRRRRCSRFLRRRKRQRLHRRICNRSLPGSFNG